MFCVILNGEQGETFMATIIPVYPNPNPTPIPSTTYTSFTLAKQAIKASSLTLPKTDQLLPTSEVFLSPALLLDDQGRISQQDRITQNIL